jgi:hypothetical protein
VSAHQAKRLINSTKKYVLIFLRQNQKDTNFVGVKASFEGCMKEQKVPIGRDFVGIQRSVPRSKRNSTQEGSGA